MAIKVIHYTNIYKNQSMEQAATLNREINFLQAQLQEKNVYIFNLRKRSRDLLQDQNEVQENISILIKDVETNLGPKLKKYHESRVNLSKRGGGGANAVLSFNNTKKKVKYVLNECGYYETEQDIIPMKRYHKNIRLQGIIVHFRIRTPTHQIINIVIQTQKQSGGAYKKSSYAVESMIQENNEHFFYVFDTNRVDVINNVQQFIASSTPKDHIEYMYDINAFKIRLLQE